MRRMIRGVLLKTNGIARRRTELRVVAALLALVFLAACTHHRPPAAFRVIPANPEYQLRAPDSHRIPFSNVLNQFTPQSSTWVELRPEMELRVEMAYYREGSRRRELADYLGTGTAHYQVRPNGTLHLVSKQSAVKERPKDQPAIEKLVEPSQSHHRFHRFFYEILLNRKAELRGAVLLGAASAAELDRLTSRLLSDPAALCSARPRQCTIFPETCIVSLEIEILVNGEPRTVLWGSSLSTVAPKPRQLELMRLNRGRPVPVEIEPVDPDSLRLPLLPGDHIDWR